MATRDELERLSSKELHDRAVALAERRVDVGFLWRLLKALPAAEAATGDIEDADASIINPLDLLNDLTHAGEGDLAEALRPFYVDYLEEHGGGD